MLLFRKQGAFKPDFFVGRQIRLCRGERRRTAASGGSGSVTLSDCVFTGNSTAIDGEDASTAEMNKRYRLQGGAIYADRDFAYKVSKDITNAGNTANSGGFLYLNSATATFDIGGNLTIGEPGQPSNTDSIAGSGTIVKTGDGTMTICSYVSGFTGNWLVSAGTLSVVSDSIADVRIENTAVMHLNVQNAENIKLGSGAELHLSKGNYKNCEISGTLHFTALGDTNAENIIIHSGAVVDMAAAQEHLRSIGFIMENGAVVYGIGVADGGRNAAMKLAWNETRRELCIGGDNLLFNGEAWTKEYLIGDLTGSKISQALVTVAGTMENTVLSNTFLSLDETGSTKNVSFYADALPNLTVMTLLKTTNSMTGTKVYSSEIAGSLADHALIDAYADERMNTWNLKIGSSFGNIFTPNFHFGSGSVLKDTVIESGGSLTIKNDCTFENLHIASGGDFAYDGNPAVAVSGGTVASGGTLFHGVLTAMSEDGGFFETSTRESAWPTYISRLKNFQIEGGTSVTDGTAENLDVLSGSIRIDNSTARNIRCSGADLYVYGASTLEAVSVSSGFVFMYSGNVSADVLELSGNTSLNLYETMQNKFTVAIRPDAVRYDGDAFISDYTRLGLVDLLVKGDGAVGGRFTLAVNEGDAVPEKIKLTVGGSMVDLAAGTAFTNGNLTYTYSYDSNALKLDILAKLDTATGKSNAAGDVSLLLQNTKVRSLIAASSADVSGNAATGLELVESSTCNIYGGGNNVNVGGDIKLSVKSGGYTGVIYGGSRAYAKTVAVHDIAISVGGIVHSDNHKLIAAGKGNSAWIVGGGVADNGQTLTAGAVNITIDGANIVRVVGGAQAQNAGSTATAASVNITVRNSTVAGDLFGGGYAYNGGTSVVSGTTAVTIDTTAANVTVMGNIYGGGANPSYYSRGGSTPVNGGSTVTFTGLGEKLTVGTVSGDGMIAGTVTGTRTLKFKAFSGEFSANIENFDAAVFAGSSSVVYSGNYEFNTMTIEYGSFADGFVFADGDRMLKIETGDSTAGFDLMTVDDISTLDGLKIEVYKNDALLCAFDYGSGVSGYSAEVKNGVLSLIA
ncbi:MAG: hypothetical protein PHI85_02600 [Victivallaceae bacterium]|nr:hypothetical protein [Victivallaceae bacterium]